MHFNALELFAKEGMLVTEKRTREDFQKAGCSVREERIYIPHYLVEETIKYTPRKFSMYDSYGKRFLSVGGEETSFGPGGFKAPYLDWRDGQVKDSDYQGLADEAKIVEMTDEIGWMKTSVQPVEKPACVQDLWMAKGGFVYSRKPLHTSPFGQLGAQGLIEMAAEIMGGADVLREKPHLMFNMCTLSPLTMRKDMSEAVREAAAYGVPCFFTSGPMAGATAPVTLAGELTQAWAEILGHNTYLQICKPGSPAVFASWSRIFDMKNATCTVGTPEYALMRQAITQLGKRIEVPTGGGGFLTDSNTLDMQCGWEKFMNGLGDMRANQNLIYGLGLISQMNIFSLESMVIDCEMIGVIQRLLQGIKVDPSHLAYDEIAAHKVDGRFLSSKHTKANYVSEVYWPKFSDRRTYGTWEKDERNNDIRKRVRIKIEEMLNQYSYSLGLEKEAELDRIITKYEAFHL
ncbi:trimethylamine methyltransferase family protein [Emergencia timonensis]|nr:trimethylamine methyltransferase family protein [Emergencia timonensis]MCB6477013.1 trimethylamine methyltransferase family protein [Emergencia timonensis]